MGVSLAVWSPIHGSGKTVFTFLLSCKLAQIIKRNMNILVCCTCMTDSDIMGMAGAAKDSLSMEELVNAGIPSVNEDINISNLLCHSGNVSFIDSSKATSLFVKKNSAGYLHLLGYLKQKYDLVIADTSSEPDNLLTQLAMENCDHVLNLTVQDVQLLGKNPPATQRDLVNIINRYTSIYPDLKELSRLLGARNLFTLPYCSQLQEMKNRKQLYRYAEFDTEYMKAMDKLARFLVKALDLPFEERKKNNELINLFSNFEN